MKLTKILPIAMGVGLGLSLANVYAADDNGSALKTQQDKVSYSLGLDVGHNIQSGFQSQNIDINPQAFTKGIQDAMTGTKPAMTQDQIRATLMEFQNQMVQKAQQKSQKLIVSNHDKLVSAKGSPVTGNPKGETTLVEFFDYQCVHCRAMQPIIDKLQKEDPNLRVVYKEFPIFGAESEFASKAALAAEKQGKYSAFHEALMKSSKKLDSNEVLALAKQAGLDVTQLKKDMNDGNIAKEIKANQDLAKSMNILGTPAFVVTVSKGDNGTVEANSFLVPGTTDLKNLEQLITKVQNRKGSTQEVKFPADDKMEPGKQKDVWPGV